MNCSCFPSMSYIGPYRSFYNDFTTVYFRPGPTDIFQVEENLRQELHSLDGKVSDLNNRKKNLFTFCISNARLSSMFLKESTMMMKSRALLQLAVLFWKAALHVAQGCIYASVAAEDSLYLR